MQTAVLSIIGIILGAFFQYFFTRYLEQQRQRREIRTRAYIDYMSSVSDQANLHYARQTKEWRAIQARTADAKCRICLYGSSKVIEAFANFERLGAVMNTDEGHDAFVSMVVAMRRDSISNTNIEPAKMSLVLLGHRPKTG